MGVAAAIGGALSLGGALLGGSDDPPSAPDLPPPPKLEDILDQIDELTGTEMVRVTGPNGKPRMVRRSLPKTPEQQAFYDRVAGQIRNSYNNLYQLYQIDPTAAVNYAPYMQGINDVMNRRERDMAQLVQLPDFNAYKTQWRDAQRDLVSRELDVLQNERMASLTRMGYGVGSTAQNEANAMMNRERAQALTSVDLQAQEAANQMMQGEIANRTGAWNLGENRNMAQLRDQASVMQAQETQRAALEERRLAQIQGRESAFKLASDLETKDIQKQMGSPVLGMHQGQFDQTMGQYRAHTDSLNQNYRNRLDQYSRTPPSFGERLGTAMTSFAQPLMHRAGRAFGDKMFGPDPMYDAYARSNRGWY